MIKSESKEYSKFYQDSNVSNEQKNNKSLIFNTDIESIHDNSNHYICTKCLKFPLIKFCKDRQNIKFTCSCFNNKKILIKNLFSFESKYNFLINNNIFSTNNPKDNTIFLCKVNKKKFSGFSTNFMDNYCLDCIDNKKKNDIIINFSDLKIKKKK